MSARRTADQGLSELTDTNPVTFADLSGEVDDYWDRGLLGLALPRTSPQTLRLRALRHDAPIQRHRPAWSDSCPTPPGPTTDGCRCRRASRLRSADVMTGSEQVLVNDWCQFPATRSARCCSGATVPVRQWRRRRSTATSTAGSTARATAATRRTRVAIRPARSTALAAARRAARCGARACGALTAGLDGAVLPGIRHRCGRARQPVLLLLGCQRRIVAYGLQYVPLPAPEGRELWIGDSAGTPGKRSTAWCRKRMRPRRFRLAVLGASPQGGYQGAGLSVLVPTRRLGSSRPLHLQPQRAW